MQNDPTKYVSVAIPELKHGRTTTQEISTQMTLQQWQGIFQQVWDKGIRVDEKILYPLTAIKALLGSDWQSKLGTLPYTEEEGKIAFNSDMLLEIDNQVNFYSDESSDTPSTRRGEQTGTLEHKHVI